MQYVKVVWPKYNIKNNKIWEFWPNFETTYGPQSL